jgi:uncharacterized protein (DUF58 family)
LASIIILLAFGLLIGIIRAQSALIMLCSLFLVTAIGSTFWSRRSVQALTYERRFDPPRIFPGEQTDYVVEVTNRKFLPLPWLRIDEHVPSALVPAGEHRVAGDEGWQRRRSVSLAWHERLVLRQRFTCAQRGNYVVGPTDVETGDPLGFLPAAVRFPETHSLVVYPRIAELDQAAVVSRFPYGSTSARPPALEDPARFAGIRDYRPGDPMRWVDWKASARRMKLQTRIFAPTTLDSVVVALNVQTMPFAWQGYDEDRLEQVIGVAAALVRQSVVDRQPVGLAANASGAGIEEFQVFLPPNRRPSQLEDVLGVLACLSPIPTLSFGRFLHRIAGNFPFGASLAVVTGFLDESMADTLERLVERGHAVSLFFVGPEVPVALDSRIQTTVLTTVTFEPIERAEVHDG